MSRATDEESVVADLRALFEASRVRAVRVGIGDDAAVLERPLSPLVWTVDSQVEGTHFEREWLALEDVGARSFHAAASDLAAMGAKPVASLSALVLPRGFSRHAVRRLAAGQARAASALGCPVAGGNIAAGPVLEVTTTLLGTARRPLLRSGARAGDELWLVGALGVAAAGLALLMTGAASARTRHGDARRCIEAWRRPVALVTEGRRLARAATAAIDVSDGLGTDAGRLARASRVRVIVERDALRAGLAPELIGAASRLGREPLDLALLGGEDYALLATGPAHRRPRGVRRIGRIDPGRAEVVLEVDGRQQHLAPGGFDHMRSVARR